MTCRQVDSQPISQPDRLTRQTEGLETQPCLLCSDVNLVLAKVAIVAVQHNGISCSCCHVHLQRQASDKLVSGMHLSQMQVLIYTHFQAHIGCLFATHAAQHCLPCKAYQRVGNGNPDQHQGPPNLSIIPAPTPTHPYPFSPLPLLTNKTPSYARPAQLERLSWCAWQSIHN